MFQYGKNMMLIYLNLLIIVTVLKLDPCAAESLVKYKGATCLVHTFSASCQEFNCQATNATFHLALGVFLTIKERAIIFTLPKSHLALFSLVFENYINIKFQVRYDFLGVWTYKLREEVGRQNRRNDLCKHFHQQIELEVSKVLSMSCHRRLSCFLWNLLSFDQWKHHIPFSDPS